MAHLPKAIIKKYGVTKKAWSVFRSRHKHKASVKGYTMAKRKGKKHFARARAHSFHRKHHKSSGGSMNLTGLLVGAAVYGAGREFVSDKLQPITSKIPAGDLADEVGLGVLSYFVAKGKVPLVNKIPYSKEIGRAGLTIEAARVGSYLAQRYVPGATQSSSIYM